MPRQALLNVLALVVAAACLPGRASADTPAKPHWVEPMRKVHARFTGKPGTLALFGDSITVSLAFWAPLQYYRDDASMATTMALAHVRDYMKSECWAKWRGPQYGNEGGMTIRWADENVDKWLKRLNPEVAVVMFGSNDLGQLELREYEAKTRRVVDRCLKNGTIVLLTTPPPRHGLLDKSRRFAEAVRRVARDKHVPLVDYSAAILKRRPDDWDGALDQFKGTPGSEYEVPTLISRDGVHPSYPKRYRDLSKGSLSNNGYTLRSYLTLRAYDALITEVLRPTVPKK